MSNVEKMEKYMFRTCGEIQTMVNKLEIVKKLHKKSKESNEKCKICDKLGVSWVVEEDKYYSFCTSCESVKVEDE